MKPTEYTYSLDEINTVAKNVLQNLSCKTVLFNGDMGSGKTTFIKALLKAMHSKDNVTSPTFSIVNEYTIPNDKVFHFDFYRLESEEEAYDFGIEEYLNTDHWLFMEWPERIESLLPERTVKIFITTAGKEKRHLKITLD